MRCTSRRHSRRARHREREDAAIARRADLPARQTQAERRARSRSALLEAAARGLSRQGYAHLSLEDVARDAGYTRGALYHQFAGKEELALAVLDWVEQTWWDHMRSAVDPAWDPAAALLAVAREHAVYCRRDIARVMMTLRVEFSGREHPVATAVEEAVGRVVAQTARIITAGRRSGSIPMGPPPRVLAAAATAAVEGIVIALAGQERFDAALAERAMAGVLGLPAPSPVPAGPGRTGRSRG